MKSLIVANWKMNPQSLANAKWLFNSVEGGIKNIKNSEVVICPPFLYLSNLNSKIPNLKLGAQDAFWEECCAFTGEVSPAMLKSLGCDYVIAGHSERRQRLKETDEIINRKIKAVLAEGLKPIFCFGETSKERQGNKTETVLKTQLKKGLRGIPHRKVKNIIIAYEPVWAIGTGIPCKVDEAKKMFTLVRKFIGEIFGLAISKNLKILYGGSVNSKNASDYVNKAGFQGLLVGGASLKPKEFMKIVKSIS